MTVRSPVQKSKITGADIKNPGRHKGRKEPKGIGPLGDATEFLKEIPCAEIAWEAFKREYPWLMESDRAFMEAICCYRAQMLSGELLNTTEMKTYQSMLSKAGGDPSSRSKVSIADDDEEEDDIFDN